MKRTWFEKTAMASVAALLTGSAFAAAAHADAMSDLIAAAQKEGELTIIAVPHDWCGYGTIIDSFKAEAEAESDAAAMTIDRTKSHDPPSPPLLREPSIFEVVNGVLVHCKGALVV